MLEPARGARVDVVLRYTETAVELGVHDGRDAPAGLSLEAPPSCS